MPQNLITFAPSAADLAAIDAAIKTMEDRLVSLIDLSPEERGALVKMGDKSEAFCRKAVEVLAANPTVLPANFNVAEMRRDLAGFDTLRTRLTRLERILEKMRDSQLALGSDLMTASLEGYALLKVSGKGEALDTARKALSVRFTSRAAKKEAATAE